jgi:Flp pilus assembly protein TadD
MTEIWQTARLKRFGIPRMMIRKIRLLPQLLMFAAAISFVLPARPTCAQTSPDQIVPGLIAPSKPETAAPAQGSPEQAPSASPIQIAPEKPAPAEPKRFGRIELAAGPIAPPTTAPDRAQAYYHMALASGYEEEAVTQGRPELATRAIEEYKLALNADPSSPQLNLALANLYFRSGHSREAENTVRGLLKSAPEDIEAHKLLGRIYLRTLSEGQNAPSTSSPSGNVLNLAITEFEKIVALQPKDVENRMVLGQLYTVKHDQKKAEEQFKTAQAMEPDSEEVVLNLARLYAESGDMDQAVKAIETVPADDRTAKMEDALGASYEQLKRTKDAIAAYQRANDLEPGDVRTLDALAHALLNDNQLDEALKQYRGRPGERRSAGAHRRDSAPPGEI